MDNLRQNVMLMCSLIACAAGVWAIINDGPTSPGGAALVIGAVGFGFWAAGWFRGSAGDDTHDDESGTL